MIFPGYFAPRFGKSSDLILLSAVVAIAYFTLLGARDFWAPVEPRYGEIVRVMFARGEWIVPTVNGDLYTDKPILYFWLALLASKLAGAVSEWTVRLPAALGGAGMVLTTYYFGRDFFSAKLGFIAALVLATCVRVIWEARWAHIDALFCCFFTLTLYFGARALLRKGKPKEILLAYACVALATLAKGLIGVVLPALLFIAYVLARRDGRLIGDARLPLGVVVFLAIAAPWFYWVQQATGGRWLTDFIYIHHVQRYTAGVGHRQPFYYYLTTLPVDFMPWTVFAVAALAAERDYRKAWAEARNQFLLLWFAVVFIFFSLSDTKRDLYLMPLLPPLALFVGGFIQGLTSGRWPRELLSRWLPTIFFALVALAGLTLPIAASIVRREAFTFILPASLLLAAGGIVAARFIWQRRALAATVAISAMMVVSLLSAALWIFPYLERFKSPRPFALEVKNIVPPSAPLYVYADTMNDFNYYLQRERMPILAAPQDVEALIAGAERGFMLIKDRDLRRQPQIPPEWIVASESEGSTSWYLIEFKPRS